MELTSTTTQVHQQHSRRHSRRHVLLRRRRCVARAAAAVLRDVLAATGPVLSRDRRRRVNGFPFTGVFHCVCFLTPVRVLSLSRHSINTHRKNFAFVSQCLQYVGQKKQTPEQGRRRPWRNWPFTQVPLRSGWTQNSKQGSNSRENGHQEHELRSML